MKGIDNIRRYLEDMPSSPGIYKMISDDNTILYIGKAKNLKKRVSNYVNIKDLPTRIVRMIHQIRTVEHEVTKTESEALLLEARLIRSNQPKYNILLKDDKSYPYIKITTNDEFPQILKYRGKKLSDGEFFGPFASIQDVDNTINILQRLFKLRPCNNNYFSSRKRPCLQYQIKRCAGPCVGLVDKSEYQNLIDQAKQFLSGKNTILQESLAKEMHEYSEKLNFEKAAEVRDRIKALSYIQLKAGSGDSNIQDADIITVASEKGLFAINVMIFRGGQNFGSNSYFPVHTEDSSDKEVLSAFIGQFYQTRACPAEILINCEIDEAPTITKALIDLYNKQTSIKVPKKGPKVKLIEHAYRNCEEALRIHVKNYGKNIEMLTLTQELFNLEDIPSRIEVYDNSHIMGQHALGAMIVSGRNGFEKKEYRTFNIKSLSKTSYGDDYAMLREVLKRRLAKILEDTSKTPDLMIIDGGVGHMGVVTKVMDELNCHLPFVCMSKGEERNAGQEIFHQPGKKPFTLDKNLPIMKFLQILRDEVHNYAIKNHREKRSKALKISSLDNIANIGDKRKKALLNFFGSFDAIKNSSAEEISRVTGISSKLAEQIYSQIKNED